jgi:hypothetical protein
VTESRKLCVFVQGITNSRLLSPKSHVLASPNLQTNNATVNFIALFLDQSQSLKSENAGRNSPRNISDFDCTGRFGRGTHDGRTGQRTGGRSMFGQGRGGRFERGSRGGSYQGSYQGNRSHGGPTLNDAYLSADGWAKLTQEEQAKVQKMRAERDSRRKAQAVRSVEQRKDDSTLVTDLTSPFGVTQVPTGVGFTMSQRKNKPRCLTINTKYK